MLAINGGAPVRKQSWPAWPVYEREDVLAVAQMLLHGAWGGTQETLRGSVAQELACLHDARFGVVVSSGTAAIHVALRSAGIGPGDEVLVPALTYYASASPAIWLGARPVLVDVDPRTYCLDPALAEQAITTRTRAIVVVHLYSHLANLDALLEISKRHAIPLIEDCGHVPNGQWRGRGVGSWGLTGCFSLTQSKALTAGEGGLLLTSDAEQHRLHRMLSSGALPSPQETVQPPGLAYNYRCTQLQATLLHTQLAHLPELVARREANMRLLDAYLAEIPGLEVMHPYPGVTQRSCYRYVFKYAAAALTGMSRASFAAAVQAEGIPLVPAVYTPLHRLPLYTAYEQRLVQAIYGQEVAWSTGSFPVAEKAADVEACTLHHAVLLGAADDMVQIAEALTKVLTYASQVPHDLVAVSA